MPEQKKGGFFSDLFAPVGGFGVTFATMFRKLETEEYPEEKRPTQPRYHGRHQLNRHPDGLEKCVGCELCAWACPADAIYVEGGDNTEDARFSPGERYGRIYQINYLRCIFCGLCIEACPTRALTMTNFYELADDDRGKLIYEKQQLLAPLQEADPHLDRRHAGDQRRVRHHQPHEGRRERRHGGEGRDDENKRTPFSQLSASVHIKGGVATNDDLKAKSPQLDIVGSGRLDLVSTELDYSLKAQVLPGPAVERGPLRSLVGITVPVRVAGPLDKPGYAVDWGSVAAEALLKRATGTTGKPSVDQLIEGLGGLLGRRKK